MKNHTSQKGITLIALIITIIVMLILVGVTINVALNGGLFEKGEKAAFQTGASTVKEQIELAKALKVMNAKGKTVEDYSDIVVGNLSGLDENTIKKYANKIVVDKNGDICYNPAKVTEQEKTWLEEIGINAYAEIGGNEPAIQGIKYCLMDNSKILQKIDYSSFTITTYNIENGKYSKDPTTPVTFELGEATTEKLEIYIYNGLEEKPREIQKGAIPLKVGGTIVGYYDNNGLYTSTSDFDKYYYFQLITDELQIEEFENAIANI